MGAPSREAENMLSMAFVRGWAEIPDNREPLIPRDNGSDEFLASLTASVARPSGRGGEKVKASGGDKAVWGRWRWRRMGGPAG